MAKASINFKIVQANSKAHNERLVELDYNYPELQINNETWKLEEIDAREKEIRKLCKDITKRKMQKNAEPIREAVVNLNHGHSMEDLKKLAEDLHAKKGIQCFQIHIHRDEGKSKEEINYHAHMLFDWQNKTTGKTFKMNRSDLSQIQDIVASNLQMERGQLRVNSNRQRLEPIEYKRVQEEKRLQELQKQIELLEQKKNTASEAHRRAESENREIEEGERAQKSAFKQRSNELGVKGIELDKKTILKEADRISEAVKRQCTTLDKQQQEIERLEGEIRSIETKPGYVAGFRIYEQNEREIKQFEELVQRAKHRQQELRKRVSAKN